MEKRPRFLRSQRHIASAVSLITILCFSSFLNPAEESLTPDYGLQVPDGFTIERAVDPALLSYPMFASFDPEGRLFVFESTGTNNMGTQQMLKNPTYHIRLLEDTDGDGIFDKSGIFADRIPLPMGGAFFQGSLYVAESPHLVKYTDTDRDGKADQREVILSGWVLHANAATLSGPFIGPDGWLYLPDARRGFDITSKEGERLKGKGARIWRCKPDGTRLESMSGGGFDNAIEIAFMPSGETIGTMTYFTDPQGGYRDALIHWVEGGVYPKPLAVIEEDKLKLTGDLMPVMRKTARVAPSGLMRMKGAGWGKAYQGNLFSAEFNTGRIMRHIVTPQGASYTTEDSPFMTSSATDSHPTDVLQDADGSMLVVITGGWFIDGCPLSRVAKPDVAGGIYRIRKKTAGAVPDAWGRKMNWENRTANQLAELLKDKRPAVRTRAAEMLVRAGHPAVPLLSAHVRTAVDEESRLEALYALARIESPGAQEILRGFLTSRHAGVRTASARSLGLAKDTKAVDALMKLIRTDVPQVRRQAATALGQIGDPRAIPALLEAAASVNDRFTEHAIIFSLIGFGVPAPLLKALQEPSGRTRKAALIALDQMDHSVLEKEHLLPFLESDNEELRTAGIWVATHHPGWTDMILSFLEKRLRHTVSPDEALSATRDLMVTFCKNEALQAFIAQQLNNPAISPERKLLFLSVIGKCDVQKLPPAWTAQLGELLRSGQTEIMSEALNLVQSRKVEGLHKELAGIAANPAAPAGLRLRALAAGQTNTALMTDPDFQLVTAFLGKAHEAPIRQAAANLLMQASLSGAQLAQIVREHLPVADPFLLPSLIGTFAGGKSESAGLGLVQALKATPDRLRNISEADLLRVLSAYPDTVGQAAQPVLAHLRRQHTERAVKLAALERALPEGDVLSGRKLFFGKAACSACHAVGNEGGNFGPDLTNIGDIRSRSDLLEAVLYPGASFAREHETVQVTTGAGSYVGIIKEQTAGYLLLATGPGPGVRIGRSEITAIEPHDVSMMPPGLDELLSLREMADLMTFMETLPHGIKRAGVVKTR